MATIVPNEMALRDEIANAAPGETITFNSSGIITLTGGELVIDKALTIDAETNNITIDAGDNSRVFNIDDGTNTEVDVVLKGITITGGSITGNGGGIFNDENLTITDSIIDDNTSTDDGGGIFNQGTLSLSDSTISNNETTTRFADGAGIFNNGILTIADSTITGNFAEDDGAGVYTNDLGTSTISGSTIEDNTSTNDGGGLFNFGDVTVIDTTISNNQSLSGIADGGGVAIFGDTTITNSTITGNSAGDDGGGVYVKDVVGSSRFPSATISGTTISNNTAGSDGGGLFNFGKATITDSIVTQNEAEDKDGTGGGSGIASFGRTNITSTTVTSSFVAGNADNSDVDFVGGTVNSFTSGGNNQIGKGNAISAFGTSDQTGIMPGITLTETNGSTEVEEGGATDTYQITLDSQPTDDVVVNITSDGESTTDQATLTFNSSNWNTPQTVTVEAVDDGSVEGDHISTISHTVTSSDTSFDGLTIDDVVVNITDNDFMNPNNPILGTSGNDGLTGSPGNDIIDGRGGNDTITGLTGDDTLFGSGGEDSLVGDNGNDQLSGGGFADTLLGGAGNDILSGDNGADFLNGGFDQDTLLGGKGADTLEGSTGRDSLFGGNGVDSLLGGDDNDTLDGGKGRDFLLGGQGADSFVLRSGDGNDMIENYDDGTDNLLLEGINLADLSFVDDGTNTTIRYTNPVDLSTENLVTLNNIDAAILDSTDFLTI
ncbi:MAG: hypothetical protein WBA13_17605 [Microcoleaceae cyanobacterium]